MVLLLLLTRGIPNLKSGIRKTLKVMSWLLHSIIPEIGEGFLSPNTIKNIWDTVSETYSKRGNIAHLYDLQRSVDCLD